MWAIDIGWFSLLTGSRIGLVLEDYYYQKVQWFLNVIIARTFTTNFEKLCGQLF